MSYGEEQKVDEEYRLDLHVLERERETPRTRLSCHRLLPMIEVCFALLNMLKTKYAQMCECVYKSTKSRFNQTTKNTGIK